MIKDNVRVCDACDFPIEQGERYRAVLVSEQQAWKFKSIIGNLCDPEMIPTFTEDSKGNVRLDICLDCYMHIGVEGAELIN
jgi:hypothetical protein